MTRVTHEMIANQVVFNLSRNLSRFMTLQNVMSTGKRINKASDDPIGAVKSMSYRGQLADITQFKSNISVSQTWVNSSESSLNDMNIAISSAYETAVAMSNDTYDDIAMDAAANEVQSLLDQILEAGNANLLNSYLFAGYRTDTKPYEIHSTGVVYVGDSGTMDYRINTGAKVQINLIGSDLLTKPFRVIGEEADMQPGVVTTTSLSSLHAGNGVNMGAGTFTIKDVNLDVTYAIDVSLATSLGDVINQINAAGIPNFNALLGPEGNNLRLEATDNNLISLATPLANLNSGNGLGDIPGQFRVRDASGAIDVMIDLSGDETIGDAINSFNNQLGPVLAGMGHNPVTAAINAGNTGIDITDTNAPPLGLYIEEASDTDNSANGLGILGNIDPVLNGQDLNPAPNFTISESAPGETIAADLGLIGKMNYTFTGSDLDPILEGTTNISQLRNCNGIDLGVVLIKQGDVSLEIDLSDGSIVTVQDFLDAINTSSLDITASINANQTGIQIVNDDPTKTLIVTNSGTHRTASDLGITGSTDVLGNIMLLVDSLRDADRDMVRELIEPINDSLNIILNNRAVLGAKVIRMETTLNRLDQTEVEYTKLLSNVEDADLTEIVTDLAIQENAYMAALNAAAKIIQPSLLNFIR